MRGRFSFSSGCSLLVLALTTILGPPARAAPAPMTPIHRHILALIDRSHHNWDFDGQDAEQQFLEMPLNYLGMTVVRHDVRDGPPAEDEMQDLRAVLTCFDYTEEPVPWLWPWLEKMRKRKGLRFLHFRGFGPMLLDDQGKFDYSRIKRWLSGFGLGFDGRYEEVPLGLSVELRDPKLCAYESDPRRNTVHTGPFLTGEAPGNVPWVTTRCPSRDDRARVPVVTGPWGGIALAPWIYRDGDKEGDRRLYLDLFRFFEEALATKGLPAPQPSVLNGRRMFFCHVDGDGFESLSTVDPGELCGKVFLDRIVKRYALPFTISVIIASLTDSIEPSEPTRAMKAATLLLNHPRVEPATHTVLHPFSWVTKPGVPFPKSAGFPGIKGYVSSPEGEVRASVRFIDQYLLERGRHCRMVLWSGDATPPACAIEEANRMHCLNLNGGTYRYDDLYDSVAYVPPFGCRVGSVVQVYCGATNENVFEGYFTEQPGTFAHVETSIERTGSPRILKPANVYVHFYSVEKPVRMKDLEDLLDRWGQKEETAPVFASTYAAAARDALLYCRIFRTESGWAFRDFGACRTVRIDDERRPIDWDASPGILGARTMGGSLYLALGSPDADVAFRPGAPPRPHIEQANHVLTESERDAKHVAVTSESVAPRMILFAGFPPGAGVDVVIDGRSERRVTDTQGRIRVDLEPGRSRIEVRAP